MKGMKENIIINKLFKNALFDFYDKKVTIEYIEKEIKNQDKEIVINNIMTGFMVFVFSFNPAFLNGLFLTYWLFCLCKNYQRKECLKKINTLRKNAKKDVFLAYVHKTFKEKYISLFFEFRKELLPYEVKKELTRIMTKEDVSGIVTVSDFLEVYKGSDKDSYISFKLDDRK